MLFRQHRRRTQHRDLHSVHHRLERRANRHLSFAVADIAANQPVHRFLRLHVGFHFLDGRELIRRFIIGKRRFKLALPRGVRLKCVSFQCRPRRVDFEQLAGQIHDGAFRGKLLSLP